MLVALDDGEARGGPSFLNVQLLQTGFEEVGGRQRGVPVDENERVVGLIGDAVSFDQPG